MPQSRRPGAATAARFVWGFLLLAWIVTSRGAGAASLSTGTLDSLVAHDLQFAQQQLARSVTEVADPSRFPRSTRSDGTWKTEDSHQWTSGFFPGCLWMLSESTSASTWRTSATSWTSRLEGEKNDTSSHDVGFKILCSFGNAYRLTGDVANRAVVIQGAQSLATRYNTVVGCTRSWNNYTFPVIVDNMMNLEILFWAARNGGNAAWYDMALSHALRTRLDHVRADGSTYHLVDYNPTTGAVLSKVTVQGYSNNSTWARGQAWALHGFTMAYRETHEARLLDTAQKVADWFIGHLPADHVPYWDFNAPNIPNEPRDTSAAAIAASGLLELSALVPDDRSRAGYRSAAIEIITSLSSPAYLAEGSTSRGLLLHGVGNKPANSEVDVSLIYGDYYFLEALLRYRGIVSAAPSRSAGYSLMQNVPNPFNPWTSIGFEIPWDGRVALRILDARGVLVRTLVDGRLPGGSHALIWDGTRGDGRPAPSGVYLYELQAGNIRDVRKASLIR